MLVGQDSCKFKKGKSCKWGWGGSEDIIRRDMIKKQRYSGQSKSDLRGW